MEQRLNVTSRSPYRESMHRPLSGSRRRGAGALIVAACAVSAISVTSVWAEDAGEPSPEQRQLHLQNMRSVAQTIRVFDGSAGDRVDIKLAPEPALRYNDNTRGLYDSAVWFLGSSGRPQAALAIEFYPKHKRGPQWLFELVSLSDSKLAAERQDWTWAAKRPGVELRAIPDSQSFSDKPAIRLSHMKSILRRFSSYESEGLQGRIELRPLANPLCRYQDPAQGALDGAIFAFANGTNPELLLVIEARRSATGEVNWFYGMAQMTGAQIVGLLDEKEVWRQPEADPVAVRDSYVNGWIAATATPAVKAAQSPEN